MVSEAASPQTPLSRRLFIAVITPLTLLAVVAAGLGWMIFRLSETARWVQHTDEVIGALYAAEKQIADQESGLRGYLLTNERAFLERYERARPLESFDQLTRLVADNPPQRSRLHEARTGYESWMPLATNLESTAQRDVMRQVPSMVERKRRMDAVRSVLTEMMRAEERLRYEREVANERAKGQLLGGAFPIFVVLGGLLAFVSRRQLSGIAQTYGDALAGERASRQATEEEAWLRDQHVRMSEALSGDLSQEEVSRRALERMVLGTEAAVGALYVVEGDGFGFRAGHGVDRSIKPRFARGEGLLGEAGTRSKVIHHREVPPDYLKVESASGSRDAVELVLVPACIEGVPLAVVELGFFGPASPRALAFVERVSETLATALRSVDQKTRLRDLLEESQRQAEELQTQQEELRAANDELQQHSDALRQTHAELEERKEELETSNASLAHQRDALERVRQHLAAKASEVEQASRYKSEFLANMSHELRTPLNSSLILAKLLADNKDGNLTAEQVKFASTIYSAGNDLLALINDVLDLSKVEAGKLAIHPSPVTVASLIEPVRRTFEPMAKEKALAFHVRAANPQAQLETDMGRAQQILKNLLSNAVKFTEAGEVTLEASQEGEFFVFSVQDTGVGIPGDQLEAIFEAFVQVEGAASRRFGGTGLGLSISRDLARLLGGDLKVESEAGKGSRFTLTLPRTLAAEAPRPLEIAVGEVARKAAEQARPAPEFPDDRSRLDGKRRLLLVVEDDVPFAEIVGQLAHEMDFHLLVAHSAEEGLRLAREFVPHAIILDIHLPDHSGLSVLDRLKRDAATRHVPVHVISALDHAQPALSMGAVGYLPKPAAREELATVLRQLNDRISRPRRLLVVEDDATQRDAIVRLLEGDGVEIVAVASVSEALARIREGSFDCMVTDLTLPDASGYDLLEKMTREGLRPFPPVVVYTGRSLSEEEEQWLRRFSSAIIVKGARSPERLLDEVTLFLHQVEAELPPERQRMLRTVREREKVFEGRKILLAEDDVRNVFALTSVLEPKGAELVIARSGLQAIEQLERAPDTALILMDIMMPEMDGLEAIREIRKRGGDWMKIPIIALTAKAMRDDQERCLAAGANDYVAKPLDVDMLLSLIRVWLPVV